MSFKNNKENINTAGRPKGSENKDTKIVKDFITSLIEDNKEQIKKDFLTIEPLERLKIMSDLMKFVVPIQKEVKSEITDNTESEMQKEYNKMYLSKLSKI